MLLDTHVLLWWLADDPRLSVRARVWISDPVNTIVVSAVSGWEMSIKKGLGKLNVDLDALMQEVVQMDFTILDITMQHGMKAGALPPHHRDPFDRLLIAQAQAESLSLVTVDTQFSSYDVDLLW